MQVKGANQSSPEVHYHDLQETKQKDVATTTTTTTITSATRRVRFQTSNPNETTSASNQNYEQPRMTAAQSDSSDSSHKVDGYYAQHTPNVQRDQSQYPRRGGRQYRMPPATRIFTSTRHPSYLDYNNQTQHYAPSSQPKAAGDAKSANTEELTMEQLEGMHKRKEREEAQGLTPQMGPPKNPHYSKWELPETAKMRENLGKEPDCLITGVEGLPERSRMSRVQSNQGTADRGEKPRWTYRIRGRGRPQGTGRLDREGKPVGRGRGRAVRTNPNYQNPNPTWIGHNKELIQQRISQARTQQSSPGMGGPSPSDNSGARSSIDNNARSDTSTIKGNTPIQDNTMETTPPESQNTAHSTVSKTSPNKERTQKQLQNQSRNTQNHERKQMPKTSQTGESQTGEYQNMMISKSLPLTPPLATQTVTSRNTVPPFQNSTGTGSKFVPKLKETRETAVYTTTVENENKDTLHTMTTPKLDRVATPIEDKEFKTERTQNLEGNTKNPEGTDTVKDQKPSDPGVTPHKQRDKQNDNLNQEDTPRPLSTQRLQDGTTETINETGLTQTQKPASSNSSEEKSVGKAKVDSLQQGPNLGQDLNKQAEKTRDDQVVDFYQTDSTQAVHADESNQGQNQSKILSLTMQPSRGRSTTKKTNAGATPLSNLAPSSRQRSASQSTTRSPIITRSTRSTSQARSTAASKMTVPHDPKTKSKLISTFLQPEVRAVGKEREKEKDLKDKSKQPPKANTKPKPVPFK